MILYILLMSCGQWFSWVGRDLVETRFRSWSRGLGKRHVEADLWTDQDPKVCVPWEFPLNMDRTHL